MYSYHKLLLPALKEIMFKRYHCLYITTCAVVVLQELCISVLPSFAGSIDYTSLKHSIIPLIMSLIISTPYLSVRTSTMCVYCLVV